MNREAVKEKKRYIATLALKDDPGTKKLAYTQAYSETQAARFILKRVPSSYRLLGIERD
jgi:hypothetical protein